MIKYSELPCTEGEEEEGEEEETNDRMSHDNLMCHLKKQMQKQVKRPALQNQIGPAKKQKFQKRSGQWSPALYPKDPKKEPH